MTAGEETGLGGKPLESLLDEDLARRAKALSFRAKSVVDSMVSGVHRSPHRGASVIFAEHRAYRPGDDLRRIDWRAYARTGRPVIRRFEQEARLDVTLVLDRSPSMGWRGFGNNGPSKAEAGALALGSFAYLLAAQGDAVGFRALGTDRDAVPTRARRSQLGRVFERLVAPCEDPVTDPADELRALAESLPPRSLTVIASDFLHSVGNESALPLHLLTARGRNVIVVHLLHEEERTPPPEAAVFVGLEGEGQVEADLEGSRTAYEQTLQTFCQSLETQCLRSRIRYLSASTTTPSAELLSQFVR